VVSLQKMVRKNVKVKILILQMACISVMEMRGALLRLWQL